MGTSCRTLSSTTIPAALLALLCAPGIVTAESSASLIESLERETQSMREALATARNCVPEVGSGQVSFCTGFVLEQAELKKLGLLTLDQCLVTIREKGFRAFQGRPAVGVLPASLYDSFVRSTKRAETFHPQKAVVLKKEASRIDCLHELLHVFQQKTAKSVALAPGRRRVAGQRLMQKLESVLQQVEKLERSGKKSEAQKLADRAQPALAVLKDWEGLADGIDEIEVHAFIYRSCGMLRCTEEDRDIALANLHSRREALPAEFRSEVEVEVEKSIRKKEKVALAQVTPRWKGLEESEQAWIASLLDSEWAPLLEKASKAGVRVMRLGSPAAFEIPGLSGVPESLFNALAEVPPELRTELTGSKLLEGRALARFLCMKQGGPAMVLTAAATRGTVVHELVHLLQSRVNGEYCDAISKQQAVARRFQNGEISRSEYETTILRYQAMNWLAEEEAYRSLLRHQKLLPPAENVNNREMHESYLAKIRD